ncbi:MAG: hypothetical protein P4L53_16400 [Candidatus Obscuribacterales bacterium]|nr:hypothetical protein [Candidatus Obscuribacterales bacterium]
MPNLYLPNTVKAAAFSLTALLLGLGCSSIPAYSDQIGPIDLLKTMPTPFGSANTKEKKAQVVDQNEPIGINHSENSLSRRLSDRVMGPRLYLPGSMVLGSVAEFTIKGKPGKWVALAMADKNSGAKPVMGHTLRLGPDRRLVAITQIPDSGVGQLLVETPIEGDLVGGKLYFEAAIWSEKDMSDMELAQTIACDNAKDNAVPIAGQTDPRRGIRIVPDTRPMMINRNAGLSSGKPSD